MVDFDDSRFMAAQYQYLYYEDFNMTKLLTEKVISLDRVEEKLLEFLFRLIGTRWMCFSLEPYYANEQCVCEFYANLSVVSLTTPVMTI